MAKTRTQKEQTINDLIDKLSKIKSVVFTHYTGLNVKDTEMLKSICHQAEVEYLVAKKTLLKLALEKAGFKDVPELEGEISLALSYEDEISPAKILNKFSKDHENLKIAGGILENRFIEVNEILDLAKLPSKLELLAKLVGSVQASVSGLVHVMSGNLRKLVFVLNSIKITRE